MASIATARRPWLFPTSICLRHCLAARGVHRDNQAELAWVTVYTHDDGLPVRKRLGYTYYSSSSNRARCCATPTRYQQECWVSQTDSC